MSVNTTSLSLPNTLPSPIVLQDRVVWPDDFLNIQELDPGTRTNIPFVIGSFNPQKVAETIDQKIRRMMKGKHIPSIKSIQDLEDLSVQEPDTMIVDKIVEIEDFFNGKPYWLVLGGGFHIFPTPIKSKSVEKGSGAIYYAAYIWIDALQIGLLVQFIPAFRETSSHHHENDGWVERNTALWGRAELRTREGDRRLTYQLSNTNPVGPLLPPSQ